MKSLSHRVCFVLASFAVVFSGCSKKPLRPDPSATVLGPQNGGAITPEAVATNSDMNALQTRDAGFDANGQQRGAVEPVYFDFDKFNIKADQRAKAQAAKDYLDKNPANRLLLEGHCDWRGTAEYNLSLGDKRANAVKKYLVTLGVKEDKLETLSKGSEEAAKNGDEATRAKDRRVEFVGLKASQ